MYKVFLLSFFLFFAALSSAQGHEGHQHKEHDGQIEQQVLSNEEMDVRQHLFSAVIHWLGHLHPIFLHFPIALLVMTGVSEVLFLWYGSSLFEHASRFMIITAAITVVPTVLSGFAFAYGASYAGERASFLWWHQSLGVLTALLTIAAAILREIRSRRQWNTMKTYYICLMAAFISVNLTGFFGGGMTFGLGLFQPDF
jgi:uncharacterized membrane protein